MFTTVVYPRSVCSVLIGVGMLKLGVYWVLNLVGVYGGLHCHWMKKQNFWQLSCLDMKFMNGILMFEKKDFWVVSYKLLSTHYGWKNTDCLVRIL